MFILHQGKSFIVYVNTIGDIKLDILERKGIPLQNQTLTYDERVLSDGKLLFWLSSTI